MSPDFGIPLLKNFVVGIIPHSVLPSVQLNIRNAREAKILVQFQHFLQVVTFGKQMGQRNAILD